MTTFVSQSRQMLVAIRNCPSPARRRLNGKPALFAFMLLALVFVGGVSTVQSQHPLVIDAEGSVIVHGPTTVNGPVTMTDAATINGAATMKGAVAVNGQLTVDGGMTAKSVNANALDLPATSGTMIGVITQSGVPIVHTFGTGKGGNFFAGTSAGNFSTTGAFNTAHGYNALHSNTEGNDNTASGYLALQSNTKGSQNAATGSASLQMNTEGSANTAIGYNALRNNKTGSNNIALGNLAGSSHTTGDNNIFIGHPGAERQSGVIRLGTSGTHFATLLVGNVGIGPGTPLAPLHVFGTQSFTMVDNGYDNNDHEVSGQNVPVGNRGDRLGIDTFGMNSDCEVGETFTVPASIRAEGWIATAMGLAVYSDRRIKRDPRASGIANDLATIQQLQVTDYRMVDPGDGGHAWRKGFIAQEVERVMPGAVSLGVEFVPDIFARATTADFDSRTQTLALTLAKDHGLNVGDKVRLHADGTRRLDLAVSAVPGPREFVVEQCDRAPEQLFVYGKQVSDFRSINYDRIFTTSVGALQQLKREKDAEVRALQEANADLRARLERLENVVTGLVAAASTADSTQTVSFRTNSRAK